MRKALHLRGYRFRLHRADLPGRPDIVLQKHKVAVQVHGCFWHQHIGCKFAYTPKSNKAFWGQKLSATVQRDRHSAAALRKLGWRVITIWECQAADSSTLTKLIDRLSRNVLGRETHRGALTSKSRK